MLATDCVYEVDKVYDCAQKSRSWGGGGLNCILEASEEAFVFSKAE